MTCMRDAFGQGALLDNRFKSISLLNTGTFGTVFMARDVLNGGLVAIKCLTKSYPNPEDYDSPGAMAIDDRSEELAIHGRLGHHSNIVNLITSFDTEHHAFLVLEFCPNGDLYEAIRSGKGPLETEHVRDFMLQLVDAVEYLHSTGTYHRDIKPENIFLTNTGSMKLGDFGLATTESWTAEQGVGSDRYMAPEQYDAGAGYGYSPAAADVWAIGICLLNVLFSRNPFASPTQSDPLFADYVRDRQSLFDIFPNMSEDTYNVLMQCLTLDPCKRSLSGVRDALQAVISFTTDDEALDEFCMGNNVVPATLNREPLRTPSLLSPQDSEGSFPWAQALQATPQRHARKLSIIHDVDEMYPQPAKLDAEAASIASALDSGIGMSYKSSKLSTASISMPMASSLPINSRAFASIYSRDSGMLSKSWTDLWEEDQEDEEEEQRRASFDSVEDERPDTATPIGQLLSRSGTPALDIKPSSRGSSTPRVSLAELKNTNNRSNSPETLRQRLTSQVRQFAASAPQKYSPPKRTGSSLMDKWAALGNMRRSTKPEVSQPATVQTPIKASASPERSLATAMGNGRSARSRDRSGSWRKSGIYNDEAWNLSKDWRSPQQPNYIASAASGTPSKSYVPGPIPPQSSRRSIKRGVSGNRDSINVDDIGDLEWVGGWNDFHL